MLALLRLLLAASAAGEGRQIHANGDVGGFIDEDERAGGPIATVFVEEQRLRRPQLDPADLVQAELGGGFVTMQRVDVEPIVQLLDQGPHPFGGVLESQLGIGFEL